MNVKVMAEALTARLNGVQGLVRAVLRFPQCAGEAMLSLVLISYIRTPTKYNSWTIGPRPCLRLAVVVFFPGSPLLAV
jgi:hypothetical protein